MNGEWMETPTKEENGEKIKELRAFIHIRIQNSFTFWMLNTRDATEMQSFFLSLAKDKRNHRIEQSRIRTMLYTKCPAQQLLLLASARLMDNWTLVLVNQLLRVAVLCLLFPSAFDRLSAVHQLCRCFFCCNFFSFRISFVVKSCQLCACVYPLLWLLSHWCCLWFSLFLFIYSSRFLWIHRSPLIVRSERGIGREPSSEYLFCIRAFGLMLMCIRLQ